MKISYEGAIAPRKQEPKSLFYVNSGAYTPSRPYIAHPEGDRKLQSDGDVSTVQHADHQDAGNLQNETTCDMLSSEKEFNFTPFEPTRLIEEVNLGSLVDCC